MSTRSLVLEPVGSGLDGVEVDVLYGTRVDFYRCVVVENDGGVGGGHSIGRSHSVSSPLGVLWVPNTRILSWLSVLVWVVRE